MSSSYVYFFIFFTYIYIYVYDLLPLLEWKNKQYEGWMHQHLYFIDGTTPPQDITQKFMHTCETRGEDGVIAIHCKAGLGLLWTSYIHYYRFLLKFLFNFTSPYVFCFFLSQCISFKNCVLWPLSRVPISAFHGFDDLWNLLYSLQGVRAPWWACTWWSISKWQQRSV